MAATHKLGARTFGDREDRIDLNILPKILLIEAQDTAYLTLMSKLSTKTTKQEKFTYDVDEHLATSDTTAAAVSTGTETQIEVTNPAYFSDQQLWMAPRTNDVFLVKSVDIASSMLTTERNRGNTTAAAMNSGEKLVRLSPVSGESYNSRPMQSTTPTENFNYTQQMNWWLKITNRQQKRVFYNGSELSYQQMKVMTQAKRDLNAQFIAGHRSLWTDSTEGRTTSTGGIREWATSHIMNANGPIHEYDLDTFLAEKGFLYGSSIKWGICSMKALLAFNQIGKERMFPTTDFFGQKKGTFGLQITGYLPAAGGTLLLVEDKYLTKNFNGEMLIVDTSVLKRVLFSGSGKSGDLQVSSNRQDKDSSDYMESIEGDMGIEMGSELYHARIKNIDGGRTGVSPK